MNSNDRTRIHYASATELARLIRTRELSSVEVIEAHLHRIEAVNPKVNAVVTLMGEQALEAARQAQRAVMSGATLGPLHGVPFSIKDALDTAGVLTQRGSRLFAGNVPAQDATSVARFKAAGGIPLMKTNLPEFSAWTETDNLVTGRTNNPWNLERTAGGSSGGESAAIAAGMSPIGIGSDVAISVRGPAAFTGIAALKATHGRVPYTGHYPGVIARWWHVGPMARTVGDVALGYSILKGPDGFDGYAVHARNADADRAGIAGQPVRVGWVSEAAFGPVDPEITAAVKAAAARLADLGCDVEEVRLPFLGEPLSALMTLVFGELVPSVKAIVKGRENDLHAIGKGIVETPDPAFADFIGAEAKAEALRSAFAGFFEQYDVLLCPVNPMTATPHGAQELVVNGVTVPWTHVMSATSPFNLTGLPALSVPFGFSSENLPIGVQLVAKWLDEATILRLGALIERKGGLGERRPAI
ncbi:MULTISPECIES: amidase [unclassified Caballeronia]|uniref:amidase n=1 Tax=unclassified Caballeronia TaxID=2646786 RepID=UPI00285CA30D|nr:MULTISPECIES: amidase [unclassified Caballeronia]MDR5773441.1 amidase [Caballeronia sp. LZ002]MDR5848875.1 amidase [Caballeronia sp. LZ003]